MAWYKSGTITATNGSKTVAGVSTLWVNAIFPGDTFTQDFDHVYEVESVTDHTHFELVEPFDQTTISGAPYVVIPTSPLRGSATTIVKQVGRMLEIYQQVVQVQASDKLVILDRDADDGKAGLYMKSQGVYKLRMGMFGDDEFVIQRSDTGDDSSWTTILTIDEDGLPVIPDMVTITGAQTVYDKTFVSPIITGHATIEGVLLTGKTGTGSLFVTNDGATMQNMVHSGGSITGVTMDMSTNTVSNITTAMLSAAAFSTDGTLAADSDTIISSQKAIKAYVDNAITGVTWKPAVDIASLTNLTLSGVQTINSVVGSAGVTRVAALGQTLPENNGIWIMQSGSWTRALDTNTAAELWGSAFYVKADDNVLGGTQWVNSNTTLPTLGSTAITYSQMAGAGVYTNGTGILLTGNVFSIDTSVVMTLTGVQTATNKTFTTPTINGATFSGTVAGAHTYSGALTLSAALTYGGVTLSNSVSGTGSMVLSTSATLNTPVLTAPDINGGTADDLTSLSVQNVGSGGYNMVIRHNGTLAAHRILDFSLGGANRTLTLGGDLTLAGNLSTAGAYSVTLTSVGTTTLTLPVSGVLATQGGAEAFTNKTFNAALNTLTNIDTTMFATNIVDTDVMLTANSATRLATQSAVKAYIDNAIQGLSWKTPVATVATSNVALTGEQTINGYLTSASRVLLVSQTDPKENGIWITAAGAWARAADANTANEIMWATTVVEFGSEAGVVYTNNNATAPTIGVDNITFVVAGVSTTSVSAGTGLSLAGSVMSIATNGVTYALMQQIAASSLVGNPTGGTANAQGITLGSTLTFVSSALQTAAMTGDVTTSANSFATTVAQIQGVTVSGATGTTNVVFSASPTLTGTITLGVQNSAAGLLKLANTAAAGREVTLRSSNSATAGYTLILPPALNGSGPVALIDVLGDGVLSWGASGGGGSSTFTPTSFTATAAQTSFTVSYTPGYVTVYRNGVLLTPAEYTATSGSAIVLDDAANLNDTVVVYAWTTFDLANQNSFTLGLQATTQGTLVLANTAASGRSVTLQSSNSATAGYTITLPPAPPVSDGQALLATAAGVTSWGSAASNPNLIINGGMLIDQRNAGASITPANGVYTLDRWQAYQSAASKYSVQQNAGAVAVLAGMPTNYLGVTSLSSYSPSASEYFYLEQSVEGYNCADLKFGTALAEYVTLSFWAYSSLTGTFGGSVCNEGYNRFYVFSYSLPVANTWTKITVTIPGDTSGSWHVGNLAGFRVHFALGGGSTVSGTAGSWGSTAYYNLTGGVSIIGTNAAKWLVTGVKLEKGTVATAFESHNLTEELIKCQRYFETSANYGTAPAHGAASNYFQGFAYTTSACVGVVEYKVPKRAVPSLTYLRGGNGGTGSVWNYYNAGFVAATSMSGNGSHTRGFAADINKTTSFTVGAGHIIDGGWTADAEL